MLKLAGYLLIFTSILHFIGGFVFFLDPLVEIARDGWWNAVSPDPFNLNYEREAAFWYVMISPLLFALGILCCWIEEQKLIMPAFIGWILLIITIVGIVILPVSGIWLLLAPSGIILFISLRNKDSNLDAQSRS